MPHNVAQSEPADVTVAGITFTRRNDDPLAARLTEEFLPESNGHSVFLHQMQGVDGRHILTNRISLTSDGNEIRGSSTAVRIGSDGELTNVGDPLPIEGQRVLKEGKVVSVDIFPVKVPRLYVGAAAGDKWILGDALAWEFVEFTDDEKTLALIREQSLEAGQAILETDYLFRRGVGIVSIEEYSVTDGRRGGVAQQTIRRLGDQGALSRPQAVGGESGRTASLAQPSSKAATTPQGDTTFTPTASGRTFPTPVLYIPCDPTVVSIPYAPSYSRKEGGYVPGIVGHGLLLDGKSFWQIDMKLPSGNARRTLTAWLKSNRGPVQPNVHVITQGPTEKARPFGIMEAAGRWRFFDLNGGLDTGVAVDKEWHHHAVSFDGSSVRYYLDGHLVAHTGKQLTTDDGPLRLGGFGGPDNFAGIIDEVYWYDEALSLDQIQSLAQVRRGPETEARSGSLIGRWSWAVDRNPNGVTEFLSGGRVQGNANARWSTVSEAARKYTISWGHAEDTVTISSDGRTLEGRNNKGEFIEGKRE